MSGCEMTSLSENMEIEFLFYINLVFCLVDMVVALLLYVHTWKHFNKRFW